MTDRIIVGVDYATTRWHASVIGVDGELDLSLCEYVAVLDKLHVDERRHKLTVEFSRYLRHLEIWSQVKNAALIIGLEEPISGPNGNTNKQLSMMAGALWAQHLSLNATWFFVNIADWKKMQGKDKSKDCTKDFCVAELKAPGVWAEDYYDALGIAEWLRRNLHG